MVTRALLLKLANSPRVERFVRGNRASSAVARRFVAGEAMDDVVAPVRALNKRSVTATLDYLGENVTNEAEARQSVGHYHRLLRFIGEKGLDANVSLKLTQLGLDISDDLALDNMRSILREAARLDQFVRIDMEGSAYTERTLRLFFRLWADHRNVGAVIQSYLKRSRVDVEGLIEAGARVRLVKGAYNEPPEVAFQRKSDVDANYVELMKLLVERGHYPAIATHDEAILQQTEQFAAERGIKSDQFEFQMLYGIRRDLQTRLAARSYRMRVYVPFGTQWYGYMMRRLAERPANLWFVARHVFRR